MCDDERPADLGSWDYAEIAQRASQSVSRRAQVLATPGRGSPDLTVHRGNYALSAAAIGRVLCGPPGISCDRISERQWWLGGGDLTGQKFPFYNKHSQRGHVRDFLHRPHTYEPLVIVTLKSWGKKRNRFQQILFLERELASGF